MPQALHQGVYDCHQSPPVTSAQVLLGGWSASAALPPHFFVLKAGSLKRREVIKAPPSGENPEVTALSTRQSL